MGEKVLMKGNEAIGEAAIRAGCRYFFGYPITPQTELPEFMARELPKVGGVFLQAESELAAINMVYGAAGAGARAMTSSSSPGVSLKQEGISYIAACELPAVIVNIVRGGPGLGNISPAQSDYFQATKGGGHGDYRTIALAPHSVQEMYDLTILAFTLADEYRNPVILIGDGIMGQMMEPVSLTSDIATIPDKPWATTGAKGRGNNIINSLLIQAEWLAALNEKMRQKYNLIQERETRCEYYQTEDAELVIVAYGTMARVAKSVVNQARAQGQKVGLFRPVTLWPFPEKELYGLARETANILVLELSNGQMLEDVQRVVRGAVNVEFHGRGGGVIPSTAEINKIVTGIIGVRGG